MRKKLQAMDADAMSHVTINLNSFSDAPSLQPILEQPLEKKSGAPPLCLVTSDTRCPLQLMSGSLAVKSNTTPGSLCMCQREEKIPGVECRHAV